MFFWPKTDVPENNSRIECCWPYLNGQNPLSPVFGQKRPGAPGSSYFAQLPPVFGHFMFRFRHCMFLSGGPLDYLNRSTWVTRTINSKISPGDVEIDKFYHFSVNDFEANHLSPCLSQRCSEALLDAFGLAITPTRTTTRTYNKMSTE